MAKTQPKDRRFFTTTEVARYCEVSNDGVLKWIKSGKLRAFSTPGGHYRISAEDFRDFLKLYAFPVQESFFGTEANASHPRRVLVVDDEPDQREVLLRLLRKIDPEWIVDQAADGYEAGIKIGMSRPDLVILDVMMPHVDGLSLCRTIRSNTETRAIRILAITGDPGNRKPALEAGADVCLTKPVGFEHLSHELTRLLDPRRPRRARRPHQQA